MIAQKILVVSRTAALVREVQAAAGAGYIVIHHNSASDADEFVDLKGPFDAMVAGPVFDSRAGMERLRRLHHDHPELPVLLALGSPIKASLPDLVRAGAADLVELPVERRHLAAALRRTLDSGPGRLAVVEPEGDSPALLADVISVASPSGGCGKTFYSTNLSYYLSQNSGRRVCLVDLDLQFGEVVSALRLKPRLTMVDAVLGAEDDDVDLESSIEDYLVAHDLGFWVLAAPRHPAEADRITLPDVTRMISALRSHFDYVVVDTSAQLSEVTLTALEQSTALICMATVDVPSIRNMRIFLDTLERLRVPTDRISVVLNKVESDVGISVAEVNEALHQKVVAVLPYAREVSRSINRGQPVMASEARADISKKLAASMQARLDAASIAPLAAGGSRPTAEEDAAGGRARRLLGLLHRGAEAR